MKPGSFSLIPLTVSLLKYRRFLANLIRHADQTLYGRQCDDMQQQKSYEHRYTQTDRRAYNNRNIWDIQHTSTGAENTIV